MIDIHNVTKIEYTMLQTEADMNLYEIYFINLWHPPFNVDDNAKDDLTIMLPDLQWQEFVPKRWEEWKRQLKQEDMPKWIKRRNDRIFEDDFF